MHIIIRKRNEKFEVSNVVKKIHCKESENLYRIKQNSANYRTFSLSIKAGNLRLYNYCSNNPIKYIDPNGREPFTYYDDLGNRSINPYVVTGKNIGEQIFYWLSPREVYDKIKNTAISHNLMGKSYSTKDPVYVCTTFLRQVLTLSGINADEFLPGGQLVKNSISLLSTDPLFFSVDNGKNPSEGTYVFYYLYSDGQTGHTGIVYFDNKGNATILHNGGNGSNKNLVNEYIRDDRDFASWFQEIVPGPVYYKQINIMESLKNIFFRDLSEKEML